MQSGGEPGHASYPNLLSKLAFLPVASRDHSWWAALGHAIHWGSGGYGFPGRGHRRRRACATDRARGRLRVRGDGVRRPDRERPADADARGRLEPSELLYPGAWGIGARSDAAWMWHGARRARPSREGVRGHLGGPLTHERRANEMR